MYFVSIFFEKTVGLSYISQRCLVIGFTSVFNLEKKIQASLCLTLLSVASSELLLILFTSCRSGSVSKALSHTQETDLLQHSSSCHKAESLIFWIWTTPLKCPANNLWRNRMNLWKSSTAAKSKSESRTESIWENCTKFSGGVCESSSSVLLCLFIPAVYLSCSVHWIGQQGLAFRIEWRPFQLSPDDCVDFGAPVKSTAPSCSQILYFIYWY